MNYVSLSKEILSHQKTFLPNIFGVCVSPFFLLLSSWLNESRQVPQSVLSPPLKPKRSLRSVINTVPLHLLYLVGRGPCCGSQAPPLASSHFVPQLLSDPKGLVSLPGGDLCDAFFSIICTFHLHLTLPAGLQDSASLLGSNL